MMYNGQNIPPMVGENIVQHVITYTANNYNAKMFISISYVVLYSIFSCTFSNDMNIPMRYSKLIYKTAVV